MDGYNEHAFVGDAADGTKRLMQVCNNIYCDIAFLPSVSDFQISPERKYALKNGSKHLLDVGTAEDFHWLVDVRLNFLKLKFCNSLTVDISRLLDLYKTKRPEYHYWRNIHIRDFLCISTDLMREMYYIYLQSLANGFFHNVQKAFYCKNEAGDILNESNELWAEEIENEYTNYSNFGIISHVIMQTDDQAFNYAIALSPDNKLFAYRNERTVEVFRLPSLNMIFSLKIGYLASESTCLLFSPNSSCLLWNSVRSCASIKEQKEVPLIPHGPESVDCCSFSPCGTKLVSSENNVVKIWDVVKKSLLVQVRAENRVEYCMFSDCNSYILAGPLSQIKENAFFDVTVLNVTTSETVKVENISCTDSCLVDVNTRNYKIISPSYWDLFSSNNRFEIRHFHLPSGEIFLIANKYCSKPFTWKGRKCVIYWMACFPQLVVIYDFENQEIVELFDFKCLPRNISISCISKIDEMNLFFCLSEDEVFVVEFDPSPSYSIPPKVSPSVTKCCALSPGNLYLASCDENRTVTIRSVDNGKVLQTVQLKQKPEACWWSELYLWVVCEGILAKFPYNSTQTKVVDSFAEESATNFKSVLKFAEGVLVIRPSDNEDISIMKVRNREICLQQIPDSNFAASSVAISSDGCAVLLYRKSCSDYQLWEIACEDRWKLSSAGRLVGSDKVFWFSLIESGNFRKVIWVTPSKVLSQNLCVSSIEFPSCKEGFRHECSFEQFGGNTIIYADAKMLILLGYDWIHFVNLADGKILNSLYVGLRAFENVSSFYIPSRAILVLAGIEHLFLFKIHNMEGNLPGIA